MTPWHVGRTVGVTLYKGDAPDDLVGVMVGPHDEAETYACLVVQAVNTARDPESQHALGHIGQQLLEWLDGARAKGHPGLMIAVDGPLHHELADAVHRLMGTP